MDYVTPDQNGFSAARNPEACVPHLVAGRRNSLKTFLQTLSAVKGLSHVMKPRKP